MKTEPLTMTPRQQREHLFSLREQDAPSPYVLANADEIAHLRQDQVRLAMIAEKQRQIAAGLYAELSKLKGETL